MRKALMMFLAAAVAGFFLVRHLHADSLHLNDITLPPGFHIAPYALHVPEARGLARGEKGTVFVGSKGKGRVYALVDKDGDQRAEEVHVIAKDLDMPVGVAFQDGSLYVSSVDRILRYDRIEERLRQPPEPVVVTDKLPRDRHHGWKYIAFGPDRKLYVSIGVPCNICEHDRDRHALIARMNPDGSGQEVFARGVRNSVGFDWHPVTGELWFTDNGRDFLGDDVPPDELNHAPAAGMDFGFPYCHGSTVADPEFKGPRPCRDYTPPVVDLGPHVAALGMRFYTGSMFPPQYRNRVFIAEHGSWNRSEKIGYRVTLASQDGQGKWTYAGFAEGWLQGSKAWGRPADLLVMPDGALLVSDDHAGVVYRISYRKPS